MINNSTEQANIAEKNLQRQLASQNGKTGTAPIDTKQFKAVTS